jgi:uncharacterized OsmC-like protein
MTPEELRTLQAPLKQKYREDPGAAQVTVRATGLLVPDHLQCVIEASRSHDALAGLHPAAGGSADAACSGDMLLEALVACAGVTLTTVATALAIPLSGGRIVAEGSIDFRGTLGLDRDVPVGLGNISLHFELETDAAEEQVDKLIQLTERYCVILKTLQSPPRMTVSYGPPLEESA